MEFINLHTSTLDSVECLGSEPVQRATWLYLLRYCCGQENSGRIIGAANWKDRQWQQLVRITLSEVQDASKLWYFDGNDLVVLFYPIEIEQQLQQKRIVGRASVAKRWGNVDTAQNRSPNRSPTRLPNRSPNRSEALDLIRKEREGKEMKGKKRCGKENIPCATLKPKSAPAVDSDWLNSLPTDPAFQGIDVLRELAKAKLWAASKKRKFSKRFILNWLMRVEAPLKPTMISVTKPIIAPMGWKQILNAEFPDSIYSAGAANEANCWEDLSKDAQQAVIDTLK